MKRRMFAIGIVIGLFALALFAFFNFSKDKQDSGTTTTQSDITPVAGEDSNDGDTTVDSVVDDSANDGSAGPTTLSLLPIMENNQGGGSAVGLGGGGGPKAAGAAAESEMPMIVAPDFRQIFVDATYTLNSTLPLEPTSANVLQHTYNNIELSEARQIADRFGFTGPLYTQVFDFGPRVMIAEDAAVEPSAEEGGIAVDRPREGEIPYQPPTVYHAFDGKRQLNIFDDTTVYVNQAVEVDYDAQVPDALQIAETFLQQRGLLDFPYLLKEGFSGGEVLVHRLVDGMLLDDPEIYVQVAGSGEIAFASDRGSIGTLETLGDYPLISAEAAWQLIREDVVGNNVTFNIMPDFEDIRQPLPTPDFEAPQYWQRVYQPGAEAHIYSGPLIYQLAEGEGPPRVELSGFVLNGTAEDLKGIGEQNNQILHVWGQVAEDGSTLNVAGWEVLVDPPYLSAEGHIQRNADQVLFLNSSGETYIIPDAPADLPDGMKVNLFAWASRDAGLAYPVLDWQNIDEWFDYSSEPVSIPMPEPALSENDFSDPYRFSAITINEVKLVYMRVFDFEGFDKLSSPPEYVQPAWEFTGATDNGDTIVLRVQAVDPEFLRAPSS